VASDPEAVHELILDIKRDGGAAPSHRSRLAALAADFRATHLMLACTELPLVATPVAGKDLIDPTDLLAAALVRRWSDSAAG
jgi:aspartate racemase